ncbi:MAG: GGDEF domain-containing protein [Planctomycetota bacterium]
MSEAQPRGRIFLAWLDRQPTWLVYLVGLALVVAVTFGDYVTGRDISFRIFYLLPVFLVTWRCGRWPGILFSTLNGISWLLIRESDFNTTLHPAQPAWNLTIEILFFYVVVFLLDAIRRGWKHVEQLSQTDALTGAANRRHFRSVLEEVVGRARTARHALSLVYMDLDNFKAVNDRHGHTVGDAVLCHTVEGIRAELRQSDLVARLGGDEFAVILPQTDRAGAQQVVERIRERLRQGYQSARWPLSLSMGVVTFMDLPATTDEIIRTADGLMYAVKTHGKDALPD